VGHSPLRREGLACGGREINISMVGPSLENLPSTEADASFLQILIPALTEPQGRAFESDSNINATSCDSVEDHDGLYYQ
jgi:hypothetical protein